MKSLYFIAAIAGLLVFIVVIPYAMQFSGRPLSNNPSDWADFGAYIGGTLGPPLALLALLGLLQTNRIQFSTLRHSEEAFKQERDYLLRKEKKEEWLVIIRDSEEQIRRYLALPVTRKGQKIGELSHLIDEVYGRLEKAGRLKAGPLKDKDLADDTLKELSDGITSATLSGLCALLGSLATYLLKYRALLVEEDKDEVVGHYISSYIHWFHRLQWIGIMSERDGMRLNELQFADIHEKASQ